MCILSSSFFTVLPRHWGPSRVSGWLWGRWGKGRVCRRVRCKSHSRFWPRWFPGWVSALRCWRNGRHTEGFEGSGLKLYFWTDGNVWVHALHHEKGLSGQSLLPERMWLLCCCPNTCWSQTHPTMSAVVFRGSMDNCHLGIDWVLLGPGLNLYACVAKKRKEKWTNANIYSCCCRTTWWAKRYVWA